MGTRKIKKNSKQKKIEKKENEKIADENHTYYVKYKKSILKVNKYDEGRYLELKLLDLLAIMEVAEECFYSSHLNMDINERKTVRTIITKYKKGIKDKIIYNFDLNVQKMKGVI